MRVALVGWDLDGERARALARLGWDVVCFTRWHAGLPWFVEEGSLTVEHCPHQIGGGLDREAASFAEAVRARQAERVGATGFDVVHALDAPGAAAAEGIARREPGARLVAAIDCALRPDGWLADHPATADDWLARRPEEAHRTVVVAGLAAAAGTPVRDEAGTRLAVWLPHGAEFDPAVTEELVRWLRADDRAGVTVLGKAPAAVSCRRRLVGRGLEPAAAGTDAASWTAAVAGSTALAVPAEAASTDPAVLLAWALGVPVVPLAPGIARRLDGLGHAGPQAERVLKARTAAARRRLGPDGVAARWAEAYLDLLAGWSAPVVAPPVPALPYVERARLGLWAVSPREALAAWTLPLPDWHDALAWLGPDAPRAVPALRLADVTHIAFHGDNAHATWFIELDFGASRRPLRFDRPGLSLAVALGVKSPRGVFLPLAHAPILHLPREEPTTHAASRRLGVLPRRS